MSRHLLHPGCLLDERDIRADRAPAACAPRTLLTYRTMYRHFTSLHTRTAHACGRYTPLLSAGMRRVFPSTRWLGTLRAQVRHRITTGSLSARNEEYAGGVDVRRSGSEVDTVDEMIVPGAIRLLSIAEGCWSSYALAGGLAAIIVITP